MREAECPSSVNTTFEASHPAGEEEAYTPWPVLQSPPLALASVTPFPGDLTPGLPEA